MCKLKSLQAWNSFYCAFLYWYFGWIASSRLTSLSHKTLRQFLPYPPASGITSEKSSATLTFTPHWYHAVFLLLIYYPCYWCSKMLVIGLNLFRNILFHLTLFLFEETFDSNLLSILRNYIIFFYNFLSSYFFGSHSRIYIRWMLDPLHRSIFLISSLIYLFLCLFFLCLRPCHTLFLQCLYWTFALYSCKFPTIHFQCILFWLYACSIFLLKIKIQRIILCFKNSLFFYSLNSLFLLGSYSPPVYVGFLKNLTLSTHMW